MDELFAEDPPKTIVARPEGDGFYVRLYPQPELRMGRLAVVAGGWLALCGALAWLVGRGNTDLMRLLFGALGIFGMLLYALNHGRGFFPVEVSAARGMVFFAGERLPATMIAGCEVDGEALTLRGSDGLVRGRIDHLPASATGWVHRALRLWLDEQEKA